MKVTHGHHLDVIHLKLSCDIIKVSKHVLVQLYTKLPFKAK
jgi:hypothetical protein